MVSIDDLHATTHLVTCRGCSFIMAIKLWPASQKLMGQAKPPQSIMYCGPACGSKKKGRFALLFHVLSVCICPCACARTLLSVSTAGTCRAHHCVPARLGPCGMTCCLWPFILETLVDQPCQTRGVKHHSAQMGRRAEQVGRGKNPILGTRVWLFDPKEHPYQVGCQAPWGGACQMPCARIGLGEEGVMPAVPDLWGTAYAKGCPNYTPFVCLRT